MRKPTVLDVMAFGVIASIATPAFAIPASPAPIAGVGIGAAVLIGAGYRALKRRIDR